MTDESSLQPQADSRLLGTLWAYLSSLRSFVAYAQVFVRMLDDALERQHCTPDTASLCEGLAHHIQCTSESCSLALSWLNMPPIQPQYTTSRNRLQLKPKDLIGIPWLVAFALQADGWWLRSEITWCKRAPMPESVKDRPTCATEKIFLLSRSQQYYYDADAVREPYLEESLARYQYRLQSTAPGAWKPGGDVGRREREANVRLPNPNGRNMRNYWLLCPEPFSGAPFATFPSEIPRRAILAGSKGGDTVLDPFLGSGTSGVVAVQLGRSFVGIELNPDYLEMAQVRIETARQQLRLPLEG